MKSKKKHMGFCNIDSCLNNVSQNDAWCFSNRRSEATTCTHSFSTRFAREFNSSSTSDDRFIRTNTCTQKYTHTHIYTQCMYTNMLQRYIDKRSKCFRTKEGEVLCVAYSTTKTIFHISQHFLHTISM